MSAWNRERRILERFVPTKPPIYHEIGDSVQVPKPLGDVEIGVIVGRHLVVMLLGGLVVAHGLGDPSQAIMQGVEIGHVLGLDRLEGIAIGALRQLQASLASKLSPTWKERLDLERGAGAGLLELADRLVVQPGPGQAEAKLKCRLVSSGLGPRGGEIP